MGCGFLIANKPCCAAAAYASFGGLERFLRRGGATTLAARSSLPPALRSPSPAFIFPMERFPSSSQEGEEGVPFTQFSPGSVTQGGETLASLPLALNPRDMGWRRVTRAGRGWGWTSGQPVLQPWGCRRGPEAPPLPQRSEGGPLSAEQKMETGDNAQAGWTDTLHPQHSTA